MPTRYQVSSLLKGIQKGLEAFGGVGNLSKALENINSEAQKKELMAAFIVESVCEHFDINRKQLRAINGRTDIKYAKRICSCLLFFEVGLSIRKIAKQVFKTPHHRFFFYSIQKHRAVNPDLKPDQEYSQCYDKILAQVNLKMKATDKTNTKNINNTNNIK